jgi:hypothetical protein
MVDSFSLSIPPADKCSKKGIVFQRLIAGLEGDDFVRLGVVLVREAPGRVIVLWHMKDGRQGKELIVLVIEQGVTCTRK